MEANPGKAHAPNSHCSAPYGGGRHGAGKLRVVVILPSESVCTIRSVPWPVTVNWIFCHLELLSGIVSDACTLHYPDGSNLRKSENLILTENCEKAVVLRLQLRDEFHGLWKSVTADNWSELEEELIPGVHLEPDGDSNELEQERFYSNKYFYSLFLACRLGRDKICRQVLSKNDIVNRVTKFGHTALHAAVIGDKLSIVDILLQNKASLTVCNALGQTSLHTAINRSSNRCAKKLRSVLFHERPPELCPSPVSPPGQHSQEPPPTTPTSRARMLFTKYGIKETIPKPWHPSQNATSKSTPCSRDKRSYIDLGPGRSLQDINPKPTGSLQSVQGSVQAQDNPETRRAMSAGLPSTHAVPRMYSRGGSAELGKPSYWARISKARILLQRSCMESPSLVGFQGSSDSAPLESKLKVVDFRLVSQSKMASDCLAPHPSPESPSPPCHVTSPEVTETTDDFPEEKNMGHQFRKEESENHGKYDRQSSLGTQYSSCSGKSPSEADRMSLKPPNRVKWLSVKRKLRLAYLQSRTQRTKTGRNEAAFKAWMDRKAKEARESRVSQVVECKTDSEDENSGDDAFQKWLHDKRHAPQNHRVFRGRYKSVFYTGSTMVGEAKYPDIKENKNAYKNWLKSREGWKLDWPSGVSRADFKRSKTYKDMEAQGRQMRISAVTYEEWMDAKYMRERVLKEMESLDTPKRKQEM